ncbi:unnamed protein product [Caenorhabditis angaria]|uniref:Uncharacterized protein n=1 Tax=Caenorhabditis angaria TaxID=860376 RepID=A0A9P1MVH4_9PELO|nr:unnamed protein product [Caenorhabditis angaria]
METYTMGDLEDIVLALCTADRDESEYADERVAEKDCKYIYDYAINDHFGTDEDEINRIFFETKLQSTSIDV